MRLWREKRGEVEPQDFSRNIVVQLGVVTEELNRRWYETNTRLTVTSGYDARTAVERELVLRLASVLCA